MNDDGIQTVGIRELRHDFRAYVDRVRRGERFIVTDRGVPVGEFVPHVAKIGLLERMVAEGRAIPPSGNGQLKAVYDPNEPITTEASEILAAMRKDER